MPLPLAEILLHPSLAGADPLVLTGPVGRRHLVRWVHSSEVLDIAPLLHGGELLLTGGAVLAGSHSAERCRYIRELAARHVTGVAIETGSRLPSIPADMLEEASRCGFPVIELRRVVPFVDVTEAINGALVNSSITRLKYAAELAHALSGIVAEGGGVREILDELAARTAAQVALFDNAGGLIGSAPHLDNDDLDQTCTARAGITAPVSTRGIHTATLAAYPAEDADEELLHLLVDRGSESLGLALLRSRPPTTRDLAISELVRLSGSDDPNLDRVRHLGELVGLRLDVPVVGVVGLSNRGPTELPRLERLLKRYGPTVVDRPGESELHALVQLHDRQGAGGQRTQLLADLQHMAAARSQTTVVVGPAFPDASGAPTSLRAALETMRQLSTDSYGIVDAKEHALNRLFIGDGQEHRLERIVSEQLALFASIRPRDREVLLASLEAYFESGFNKSAAATRLRVERQTLHARLHRAFKLLGGDPTGTPAALPLHLAVRLRLAPTPPGT